MAFHLFHLEHDSKHSLQQQLKIQLTKAIFNGSVSLEKALPSSRQLAQDLKISRNTVVRVYEQMLSENLIVSKQRSGYFINPQYQPLHILETTGQEIQDSVDWEQFLPRKLSQQANIVKHQHWQRYKYPFIYGQFDPQSFPIAQWRECSRDSVSVAAIGNWASDQLQDDPMLIEHIQTHILPRRGIAAKNSQNNLNGAATKSRTRDPLITSQVLYQLSYSGKKSFLVGTAGFEPATTNTPC